tara:strand:+ start:363 stop:761 length:399 start_codon:yes stop_codon:yes gene_type:complete
MNNTSYNGSGSPNKTTKVNTTNVGYTIVASVRMHSDAGPGYDEDKMVALGVNKDNGDMVCWDTYWCEENRGWMSGSYQPYRWSTPSKEDNMAVKSFLSRIERELEKQVSRALGIRDQSVMPTIDESMPEEEE